MRCLDLGQPVELGFSLASFRAEGEWGRELIAQGQEQYPSVEIGKIGLGFSGALAYDLVTGEPSASLINIPATFQVAEQFKINVNAGWLYIRSEDLNWFTYGAGLEWNFVKLLTLIGEVFGIAGHVPTRSARAARPASHAVESVDIDLIYGRNILGENANW
jgi:hypothetical protein